MSQSSTPTPGGLAGGCGAVGCVFVFMLFASAIFASLQFAAARLGADIPPLSWWGHYSALVRGYSTLFAWGALFAVGIAAIVGSIRASTALIGWWQARRFAYFSSKHPEVYRMLLNRLDSGTTLSIFWGSFFVVGNVGVLLFATKTGSLFWVVLLATAIPLSVLYIVSVYTCRRVGAYALHQVRQYLLPYVFVTPIMFGAAGMVAYLVYYAVARISVQFIDPWMLKYDPLILELAAIPPNRVDYSAIGQALLWSTGSLALIVATLPLVVRQAYGKLAAAAVALLAPVLVDYFEPDIRSFSATLDRVLTTVPPPAIAFGLFFAIDWLLGRAAEMVGGSYECPQCGHGLDDVENLCGVCGLRRGEQLLSINGPATSAAHVAANAGTGEVKTSPQTP